MTRKTKWKSTTWLVTVWAVAILSYCIVRQLNASWMSAVLPILAGIIVTYVGGNKAVDYKHGPEMRDENKG